MLKLSYSEIMQLPVFEYRSFIEEKQRLLEEQNKIVKEHMQNQGRGLK